MSTPTYPFLDANTRLMKEALGGRLALGVADYIDLFTEDAVLELPYGSSPAGDRVVGREAIAAYMEKLRGTVTLENQQITATHACDDSTVVIEYDGIVLAERTGRRAQQRYVAVVTLKEGRIALFREYSNPLLVKAAFAGVES